MNINFNDLQTIYNGLENELRELTNQVSRTRDLNSAERMIRLLQISIRNFSTNLEAAMSTDTDQGQLLSLKGNIEDLNGRVNSLHQNVQQRIDTIARIIIEPSDKPPITNGPQKRKFEEEEHVSNKTPHLKSQDVQSQDVLELSLRLTLPNGDVISSESANVPYTTCQNLSIIGAKVNFNGEKKFSLEFQGEEGDIELHQRLFEHLKRFFNNPADYSAGDLHQHDDIEVLFKLLQTAEMYNVDGLKERVGAQLACLLENFEVEASKETLLEYFYLLQHRQVRQVLAEKIIHLLEPEDGQLIEELRNLVAQYKKLSTTLERLTLLNMIKKLDTNDVASLQKIPSIQQLLPKRTGEDTYHITCRTLIGISIGTRIQKGLTVREAKSSIFPAVKKAYVQRNLQVPDISDFRISVLGQRALEDTQFDDYNPRALGATLFPDPTLIGANLNDIQDDILRNRVQEGVAYNKNILTLLRKGFYDQEIDLSVATTHLEAIKEALPINEIRYQYFLNNAKKVLDIAPTVNRLVHLGGRKYDNIQSKLSGEALEELACCNTENSTFLQRLTNELRKIYNVGANETIQSYTMRVESALHMISKALEILQEDSQSDKESQQFFLDSIDRVWDSYLRFLDEKISEV